MKRVKGVEDLNIRIVRAQGIVGVGVTTRIFIFSSLGVASRLTANIGLPAGRVSFCQSKYYRTCSGASSCTTWERPSALEHRVAWIGEVDRPFPTLIAFMQCGCSSRVQASACGSSP